MVRKALFLSVLIVVGILLCLGDNHACVQSGSCPGCLHSPVSVPAIAIAAEVAIVDFGATTDDGTPKLPPALPQPRSSLRAPPSDF
jgi:hypothetical protein